MHNPRDPAEREEAVALAAQLQDSGVPTSLVVAQLQRRHGYSRAQAYRITAEASESRGREGLQPPPRGDQLIAMAQRIVGEALIDAHLDGERKEVGRLAKELRELCRASGAVPGMAGPEPDTAVEAVQAAHAIGQARA